MSFFRHKSQLKKDDYYPCYLSLIDIRERLPVADPSNLKVLNVGVGEGNSGLARQLPFLKFRQLDHIDIHQPYLDAAKLKTWLSLETNFIKADIRDYDTAGYDLVLMFDVLEHLKKEESLAILDRIKTHQIIFIPLEKEFRENTFGAESQDHLSLWTEQDFGQRYYKTEILYAFHSDAKNIWDALWALK